MEKILKKKERYKLIKFPEGISLDEYKTEKRSGETGVATRRFGKVWYQTPQGKVLFKNYDMDSDGLRIVNELLYDELAKQIGLPVAKYIPAKYKQYPMHYLLRIDKDSIPKPEPDEVFYGIASVDVTKSGERIFEGSKLLDYDDFWGNETLVDYLKALDNFKDGEGYYVDKKGIKSTLFKMMVLDALTFMEDRHSENVTFLKNDEDGYLIASPVIDNEMCFAGKNLWYDKNKDFENLDANRFLELHGKQIRMFVNDDVLSTPSKDRYEKNVQELVKLANSNTTTKQFLKDTLQTLNIEEAIENVENLGYVITEEYKHYVSNLVDLSKKMFQDQMFLIENSKQKTHASSAKFYDERIVNETKDDNDLKDDETF